MPTFFYERITLGLQGSTCKRSENPKNKQSCKKQYSSDFRNTYRPLIPDRCGHNGIKNIHIMTRQNNDTGHDHEPIDTFVVAIH